MRIAIALVIPALWILGNASAAAQTPPEQQHLIQAGNLAYLGKFTLPMTDPNGSLLTYGGNATGLGADGTSLYYGCLYGATAARVEIPTLGGVARVLQPCTGVPNLQGVNPTDPNAKLLGGTLSWNGRLIVTGYSFYDGVGTAAKSHFAGSTLGSVSGPYTVGPEKAAFVAGYMGVVPQEWRSLLGGPALTGQCCISIISRTSYGPSVSVFDPGQLGSSSSIPSTMLVGYPASNKTLGDYDVANPLFSGATKMGGVAFPGGTRSVLFVGRHGATYCYGEGTGNPALAGTPVPGGGNTIYCYDPTDIGTKGTHGYPYKHMVWAYDANDLLAVKRGNKQPWDVVPYAAWTLPQMSTGNGAATMRSATYDPATSRWYVVQDNGGKVPEVHVYEITSAVLQPIEICGDGIDNDGDGQIDEGCTPGTPEICGDGIDNDGDGQIDEGCAPGTPEICGDGIDNDGDGQIDEGCAADGPEICGDGIDNDDDGMEDEGCDEDGAVPSAPRRLSGTVDGTTIRFRWSAPLTGGEVTEYVLEAGFAPGQATYTVPMGMARWLSVPNVGAGRYYVRVRARNPNGSSPPSNEVVTTVGCRERPRPLSGLTATSRGGLVNLSWTDPDGCENTSYEVGVANVNRPGDVQAFATPEKSAATLLPPGTYYARVGAISDAGISASTNVQFTVTDSTCVAPRFRTTLKANVAGYSVGLEWSPLEPDIADEDDAVLEVSYVLEAGLSPGAADLGTAPVGRINSLQTGVPPGVYYVRIRPANACGAGVPSNEVRVLIQ